MKVELEKERNLLSLEQSKLIRERQQLEQDKLKLNQSHQAVLALEQNLKIQATQVNETSHLTHQAYLEGQQTLIAAKEMHKDLNRKLAGLQILETSGTSTQPVKVYCLSSHVNDRYLLLAECSCLFNR